MGIVFGKVNVETPPFEVIKRVAGGSSTGGRIAYEVRRYAQPGVVAKTTAPSSNEAFRRLAGYIGVFSGDALNKGVGGGGDAEKIAMTAPVFTHQPSLHPTLVDGGGALEPLPPTPSSSGVGMEFLLPSKFESVDAAPVPSDPRITLANVAPRTVAVTSFSGSVRMEAGGEALRKVTELKARLVADGIEMVGRTGAVEGGEGVSWKLAQYNPPFTIPMLRTNEIHVEVVYDDAVSSSS